MRKIGIVILLCLTLVLIMTKLKKRKTLPKFPYQLIQVQQDEKVIHSPPIHILKQKFSYIGKGRHSYAFLGEDGTTVLKLFRYHFKNAKYDLIYHLPDVGFLKKWKKAKEKHLTEYVVKAYKCAYDLDRTGCGIHYAHFYRTEDLPLETTLIAKDGREQVVDLNMLLFIIQDKVTELRTVLDTLLRNGKVEQAKAALKSIVDLYHEHYTKGIYDWGIGIMHNTGFVGDQPVRFDVSKLVFDESIKLPQNQEKDFSRQIVRIKRWLDANYPEASNELLNEIKRTCR